MTLGTVRFLFPNVLSEPPSTFRAGDPANYEDGKVDDKFKPVGAWVIRNRDPRGRDVIYALSTTCTHLGCNPNWLDGEKKFKCPCHGSGFRISGINFEGPAPRPLERYAIKLSGLMIPALGVLFVLVASRRNPARAKRAIEHSERNNQIRGSRSGGQLRWRTAMSKAYRSVMPAT
jgi:hypothetical protein